MMFSLRYLTFAGLVVLLLSACGPSTPATPTTETQEEATRAATPTTVQSEAPGYPAPGAEEGYPVAPTRDRSIGYPDPASEVPAAYPAPEEERGGPKGPIFALTPVQAGDTVVEGVAPFDLQLAIVDVTFGGNILGTGRSDAEGDFSISVEPLIEGHRIGISVIAQDGTSTVEDIAVEYFPYRGEQFMNLPNVGVFFDTATVSP